MSIIEAPVFFVTCDSKLCENKYDYSSRTREHARHLAQVWGGFVYRGGKDYCRECSNKIVRKQHSATPPATAPGGKDET